ncbi:MAG: hypothetical protein GJT30_05460 [Geobacter sp.]|nr:hypothetical protein [Geobacter sp.]
MNVDDLWFRDPANARAYIRKIADQIEEPEEMMEFLNACNITQAALACWLFETKRYNLLLQSICIKGAYDQVESKIELKDAWNEYSIASEEFQFAKEKLKEIISKLHIEPVLFRKTYDKDL